jgi:methylenetetrahydrofolate--tRNA-(uracil-5-)-methyltransferase
MSTSPNSPQSSGAPIHVIGGGLAGSEAAWQIAQAGVPVVLHEMRRHEPAGPILTDAHQTDGLAEMVCSNSFRSDDWQFNAVGLLHAEMRKLDSLIMSGRRPASGAGRRRPGRRPRRLLGRGHPPH